MYSSFNCSRLSKILPSTNSVFTILKVDSQTALSENNAYVNGCESGIAKYLDEFICSKNKELNGLDETDRQKEIKKYKEKIDNVCVFVNKYFPFGFRHAVNPQSKRSVFEAISVGVNKYLLEGGKNPKVKRTEIELALRSNDFKKYTHIANELHKKYKLE